MTLLYNQRLQVRSESFFHTQLGEHLVIVVSIMPLMDFCSSCLELFAFMKEPCYRGTTSSLVKTTRRQTTLNWSTNACQFCRLISNSLHCARLRDILLRIGVQCFSSDIASEKGLWCRCRMTIGEACDKPDTIRETQYYALWADAGSIMNLYGLDWSMLICVSN
jgi:hypothetical protein